MGIKTPRDEFQVVEQKIHEIGATLDGTARLWINLGFWAARCDSGFFSHVKTVTKHADRWDSADDFIAELEDGKK